MSGLKEDDTVMSSVHSTVFKESENLDGKCLKIQGYDFNRGVDYHQLLKSMLTTGFQASNFADAIQVVNQMVLFYDTPCLCFYLLITFCL
jgi:deoxyhypusine synthase